jgi:hypothetical protein
MAEATAPTGFQIADSDYPALFLAADKASRAAQKQHLWFTGGILAALLVSVGLGVFSGIFPSGTKSFAAASTALVALSFVLTAMQRSVNPARLWYGGRAVAESAKSMCWRYMTAAEPYPATLSMGDADNKFVADLRAVVKEQTQLALGFGSEFSDKPQISPRMRQLRSSDTAQRKQAYLASRIEDQRRWYGSKARSSAGAARRFFVLILVSQALALAAAALIVASPKSPWNLVGLFSVLASALVAWRQVRQYEDLAQAYSVAALELGFIEEEAENVKTDADLSAFVADAENAVSREHTMWIARRDRG